MNINDAFTQSKEKICGLLTPARLKKLCVVAVIGVCCVGGGAWYHHQQKEIHHAQVTAARTAMTEAQAQKLGLNLLSEDSIRTLAADAIGQEEISVTYREISLQERNDKKKKPKHKDLNGTPEDGVPATFHPVYKVSCLANQIKYKLVIDAVTGDVLKSHVG